MPPAARITDMHVCPMVTVLVPHVGGPILPPGCPTVLVGGLPAARVTDMATCIGPPDVIVMGSPTVLIGNLMAARIGDPTAHGGVIVLGCFTVIIGEAGAPSPSAPGAPLRRPPISSVPLPAAVPPQGGSGSPSGSGSQPSSAAAKPLTVDEYNAYTEAVAASEDDGLFQQAARRKVAEDFYKQNCPDLSPSEIRDRLRGIDFTKPVRVVQVPPPNQFFRWGVPGTTGQYFTDDEFAKPTDLGVPDPVPVKGPNGTITKVPLERKSLPPLDPKDPTERMKCLNSTAAPLKVTWVKPPVQTKGGKQQYFIPKDNQKWKTS